MTWMIHDNYDDNDYTNADDKDLSITGVSIPWSVWDCNNNNNNNFDDKNTFNDRNACTLVHVVQKQTIGAIVIRSARLASVGSMTSNHDDHMLDCNHIYDHNKKHDNDHDHDDKRCENEGGQSHYFGCQLGAGKSLNLSNVFHPRQVVIMIPMRKMVIMHLGHFWYEASIIIMIIVQISMESMTIDHLYPEHPQSHG